MTTTPTPGLSPDQLREVARRYGQWLSEEHLRIPVTTLDAHRVALLADSRILMSRCEAERVLAEYTAWCDWRITMVEVHLDLLAQPHTAGEAPRIYVGDARYLGERWMVYAELTPGSVRFIGEAVQG